MSEKRKKYILYGASFNPPHMGHFSAIRQLLEEYDMVMVFPYPHKHDNGQIEKILPIKTRLKMVELFMAEFFPQISDKLMLLNLSDELKLKDKKTEGFLHTYDYLKYVKTRIKDNTDLHVCLGIDAQKSINQNSFYKEKEIKDEFGVFYLTEEKQITSEQIRKMLSTTKIKSNKDEKNLVQLMGYHVTKYIIERGLYGLLNKKTEYVNKNLPVKKEEKNKIPSSTIEDSNILVKNKTKPLKH